MNNRRRSDGAGRDIRERRIRFSQDSTATMETLRRAVLTENLAGPGATAAFQFKEWDGFGYKQSTLGGTLYNPRGLTATSGDELWIVQKHDSGRWEPANEFDIHLAILLTTLAVEDGATATARLYSGPAGAEQDSGLSVQAVGWGVRAAELLPGAKVVLGRSSHSALYILNVAGSGDGGGGSGESTIVTVTSNVQYEEYIAKLQKRTRQLTVLSAEDESEWADIAGTEIPVLTAWRVSTDSPPKIQVKVRVVSVLAAKEESAWTDVHTTGECP